ncbi:helix-turn-helix domain-containing protein [Citricoccus sp. GCM10030269]|uniref:AraC-like ligand-binding domain-containing protein n=1 Tax=Citricoccus sp. GCM10030269 TaxID=3273388 RepID=UPI0036218FE8
MTVDSRSPATAQGADNVVYKSVSDYARDVSEAIAPMAVESGRHRFSGAISARRFGLMELCSIHTSQHTITRSEEHIAGMRRASYKFCLQMSGSGLIRQAGREAVLRPGDIAFYDSDVPYSLVTTDENWSMIILIPRNRLGISEQKAAELTAVRMPIEDGVTATVSGFLGQLIRMADRVSTFDGARLAQNTTDLLSTLIASELGDDSRAHSTGEQPLMQRILAYIESHLDDPDLSPQSVAAATFISVRHLHGQFHQQGHTVSTWIKHRRLERAKVDLADPRLRSTPVAAVAARWGILDAPHFSRSFKATFGETPSEFRRRMAA